MKAICWLVVLLVASAAHALTLKIPAGTEECMHQIVKAKQELTFQFLVTHGGMLDIDASLKVKETTIESWKGQKSGRHAFRPNQEEDVTICLSNKMARWTPKWVSFYVTLTQDPDRIGTEEVSEFAQLADTLQRNLENVRNRHNEIRLLEARHRDLVEASNSWVLYWSIFECIILTLMAAFQVFYLRHFLEASNVVRGYL